MTAIDILRSQGYLTPAEAAAKAQVDRSTVDGWIRTGVRPPGPNLRLPVTTLGKRRFIDPDDLSRFLDLTGRQPLLPFGEPDEEAA